MKEGIKTFLTDTMGRFIDYFCLNLIFMITCLPIITIGTSCSAMFYVIFHIFEDKDAHLSRQYLRAWKNNFMRCTIVWVISLIIFFLSYQSMYVLGRMDFGLATMFLYAAQILVFYILCSTLLFFFSWEARFENTFGQALKNAFFLSMLNPRVSIVGVFISLFPLIIVFIAPDAVYTVIAIMILIGFSVQFNILSRIIFPIYYRIEKESQSTK